MVKFYNKQMISWRSNWANLSTYFKYPEATSWRLRKDFTQNPRLSHKPLLFLLRKSISSHKENFSAYIITDRKIEWFVKL